MKNTALPGVFNFCNLQLGRRQAAAVSGNYRRGTDLMKIFNLFVLSIAFTYFLQSTISLEISFSILGTPSPHSINIGVEVKNVSGKPLDVNKNRVVDYKREKIGSIGNYVIEIQIQEKGDYQLLEPSADINPGFNNGEFIEIGPSKTLSETIKIQGSLFARNGDVGFKPGNYRMRVTFNSDFWGTGSSGKTDWVKFHIGPE